MSKERMSRKALLPDRIPCGKTEDGSPSLWERGGGQTKTGKAQIICDADGKAKRPIHVRKKGHLSNSNHALFSLEVRDVVIKIQRHGESYCIELCSVERFDTSATPPYIYLNHIAEFYDGEWSVQTAAIKYRHAIAAAVSKVHDFHCKIPYYIGKVETIIKNSAEPVTSAA